jgi:hypothetical protein
MRQLKLSFDAVVALISIDSDLDIGLLLSSDDGYDARPPPCPSPRQIQLWIKPIVADDKAFLPPPEALLSRPFCCCFLRLDFPDPPRTSFPLVIRLRIQPPPSLRSDSGTMSSKGKILSENFPLLRGRQSLSDSSSKPLSDRTPIPTLIQLWIEPAASNNKRVFRLCPYTTTSSRRILSSP